MKLFHLNKATVNKLNQINTNFYNTTAQYFSSSRSYSWLGWEKSWEYLDLPESPKILDIGCGNGRYAEFLQGKFEEFEYFGFDNSKELLDFAKHKYSDDQRISFKQINLLSDWTSKLSTKYDLIVIAGVLHHVPGYENRVKLLEQARNVVADSGHIVITVWDFIKRKRFQDKLRTWKEVAIDKSDVDKHDYLMTWDRGVSALRYVHFTSEEEVTKLFTDANVNIFQQFYADGKDQNLNRYYILSTI